MTDQLHSQNRQPQVRDLTPDELDHAAGGGYHTGGVLVALGDGSVRTVRSGVSASDLADWQSNYGTGG